MTNIREIQHVTVSTGHTRISPRAEVDEETISYLSPLLNLALDGMRRVKLIGGFWLRAVVAGDILRFRIGHKSVDDAIVRCAVNDARLEVDIDPQAVDVAPEVLLALGDLERCIAWTWLDKKCDECGVSPAPRKMAGYATLYLCAACDAADE